MSDHIKKLISEGEHQRLDFKFEISDFRKIARTLVAFANTDGGRLLVGVKDNGSIAGVRTDEEFYMVEGASKLYCRPEVPIRLKQWNVDGKIVLEVIIPPGEGKPYYARDESDQWHAYIRQEDENFRASSVTLKLWKMEKRGYGTFVKFGHPERQILKYLSRHPSITLARYTALSGIRRSQAEKVLVNFLQLGILESVYVEQDVIYRLREGYERVLEDIEGSTYI